jgi:ankyrin repeat protein
MDQGATCQLTARTCARVHGSGAKAKIKGHLPLLAVAGDGPIEVVRSILDAKVDVNEVHATTGHTGLHLAAKAGRDDLLQLILDKVGHTPLGALPCSPQRGPCVHLLLPHFSSFPLHSKAPKGLIKRNAAEACGAQQRERLCSSARLY